MSITVYIDRDGWLKDAETGSSIRPASNDEVCNHAVSARFELLRLEESELEGEELELECIYCGEEIRQGDMVRRHHRGGLIHCGWCNDDAHRADRFYSEAFRATATTLALEPFEVSQ